MLEEYCLVKHRRNGSIIYQCNNYTHYMKVGDKAAIQREVFLYQTIQKYGFPLPALLEYTIEEDSLAVMKEASLGGNLFANIFTKDCDTLGSIDKDHFDSFCLYQKNHLYFQLQTENKDIIDQLFDKFDDLYEEKKIDSELINKVKTKVMNVANTLPQVRNHGDHNPYNIFTDGLIDLEDSFIGSLGYDTITALTQNFWFPVSGGELNQQHSFTDEQIDHYLIYCSREEINFLDNDIFATLFLMRGIFATAKTLDFPLLHDFRYKKLIALMEVYLLGEEDILDYFKKNYRISV